MKKIVTSFLFLFLLCCSVAFAADVDVVKCGNYILDGSTEYTNGRLQIKQMHNKDIQGDQFIFYFDVMRGSETQTPKVTRYSNFATINKKDGKITGVLDLETKKLEFAFDGDKINVVCSGFFPKDFEGTYTFAYGDFELTQPMAVAFLETLPPPMTSLTKVNRPYKIELASDKVKRGSIMYYSAKAINLNTKKVFARYLITEDLKQVILENK